MKNLFRLTLACLAAVVAATAMSGCGSAPKLAQHKNVDIAGQKLELAGTYHTRSQDLSITFNGDAALNGRFPPYTPTLSLNTKYRDLDVRAECYFASILGNRRGVMGIVATAVQSSHGKTSDSCAISFGGSVVETLYFH